MADKQDTRIQQLTMLDKQETRELWMIRRSAMQLLRYRGYLVVKEEIKQTLEQFKKQFGEMPKRSDLNIRAVQADDPTDQIYVFFSDELKLNNERIKEYIQFMKTENICKGIIVVQSEDVLTNIAKRTLRVKSPNVTLEPYTEGEMLNLKNIDIPFQQQEAEIKKLWMIRRTIFELLRDCGYTVSNSEINQTMEQFQLEFGARPERGDLNILVTHAVDPTDLLYVFFSDKPKVDVATLKAYCVGMQEEQIKRAIIVAKEGMTAFANQALEDMAPKYILEKFLEKELVVNITKHELVSEHVKMTSEETQEVLERYNIKKSQLPRIPHDDIVARYYGLRRGDAVRIIHRPETTVSGYITYRIVV